MGEMSPGVAQRRLHLSANPVAQGGYFGDTAALAVVHCDYAASAWRGAAAFGGCCLETDLFDLPATTADWSMIHTVTVLGTLARDVDDDVT
jgi:hypothetical protein